MNPPDRLPSDPLPPDPTGYPPSPHPWYRRHWTYYNRPYSGCGCLWALLILVLIWWLLSLVYPEIAIWSAWM